ncbi:BREX-3 system P-loop-containing protein BrxF [Brevibacillus centrosporus]|uniref:BREX-3 system P-loop-containing protein BrxF n=1 Tax=Brevibacillus centrosporus TaxID=54910 RepID=UPI001172C353|nr:BREX-3 system P-loop-containing protein BrxF [Brevibacillus centrosporus]MEC2130248.1 BREX-3 system P-loop-containing protein BrxF [Brevibacillus centrosporus]GED30278.1 hypothetical protein BCE02nite_14190 [Brevibacillus centrosporus]
MSDIQAILSSEIDASKAKRNKMIFIVAKDVSLNQLRGSIDHMKIPIVNVGLLLSEKIRQLPPERRPLEVGKVLRTLVIQKNKDEIFLDHIEYLFDRELKQNPIRLFENLSGNKTIIIRWPGTFENGTLKYATPEHHEYYQSDNSYENYVVEI